MANLRSLTLASGLIATSGLGLGCSGDEENGDASSSTQLKDLSAMELETECKAIKADFDALARGGCILDARGAPETCEATSAGCAGAVSSIDCDGIVVEDVASCTVTVGELKSCFAQVKSFFAPLSCTQGPTAEPPGCMESVQQKCSIFGG